MTLPDEMMPEPLTTAPNITQNPKQERDAAVAEATDDSLCGTCGRDGHETTMAIYACDRCDKWWPRDAVVDAGYAAGYTAGCSAMREAAAVACLQALKDHHVHSNFICERMIRALTDPPGGTP